MTAPLIGPVPLSATYDPPAKYKGRRGPKGDLVGTRIDPTSPLGSELVKLRTSIVAAAEARKYLQGQDEDLLRRMNEVSQNVPVSSEAHAMAQWRAQRTKVIRERIDQIIAKTVETHGRPPTHLAVPAETYDEVKEACWDYDVIFEVQGKESA